MGQKQETFSTKEKGLSSLEKKGLIADGKKSLIIISNKFE